MTELTAKERVELGALFLDEVEGGPDWYEQVNLDKLDISDGCLCVAAQMIGTAYQEHAYANEWEQAMYEWGIVTGVSAGDALTTTDNDKAKRLGFLGYDNGRRGRPAGRLERPDHCAHR